MASKKILKPALIIVTMCLAFAGIAVAYLSTLRTATWTATVKTGDLTISPDSFVFTPFAPGESVNVSMTVTNTGDISLNISFNGTGESVSWSGIDTFTLAASASKEIYPMITLDSGYSESGGSLSGSLEVLGEQIP